MASLNMLNVLSFEPVIYVIVAILSGEDVAPSWIVEWSTIDIPPMGNAFKVKAVGISTS